MEDGLVREHELVNAKERGVLILVVVEDGLVLNFTLSKEMFVPRLNPCCSGRWSRTPSTKVPVL